MHPRDTNKRNKKKKKKEKKNSRLYQSSTCIHIHTARTHHNINKNKKKAQYLSSCGCGHQLAGAADDKSFRSCVVQIWDIT